MSVDELRRAMTLGGVGPLGRRAPKRPRALRSRLKTASFSQCRCLTVASKRDGVLSCRRWDLDYITRPDVRGLAASVVASSRGGSTLARPRPRGARHAGPVAGAGPRGWKAPPTDRQGGSDAFYDLGARVEQTPRHGLPSIPGRALARTARPRRRPPREALGSVPQFRIRRRSRRPRKRSTGRTASSSSKDSCFRTRTSLAPRTTTAVAWTAGLHSRASTSTGTGGCSSPAAWLGLGSPRSWTMEEPYKLARLRLEFANSADHEWDIDVKKSVARPPRWLRPRLTDLATKVRESARKVFAHRGRYGRREAVPDLVSAWTSQAGGGREQLPHQPRPSRGIRALERPESRSWSSRR